MLFSTIFTLILIALGAIMMGYAIYATRGILHLLKDSSYRGSWQRLYGLMLFFTLGYIITIFLIIAGAQENLVALIGVIFLFGAIFVYLVVRVGLLTFRELLRTQNNIIKARDQALEASRFKSELLGRVSHELRTPLHAVLGYTDMLQTNIYGTLNDKQADIAQRVFINTEKLIGHVNDMLAQAQIESGRLQIKQDAVSPTDLLTHVENVTGGLAQEHGLTLSTHLDSNLPAQLIGDQARLQDILVNLTTNAIKFTPSGKIGVTLEAVGVQWWTLTVQDTGVGIPEEEQASIFEPFHQIDGSQTRKTGGVGLGLSIVKELVNAMHGEINLTSEVGVGSTFTIKLPLRAHIPE
jgi:signal transduction histidine kinase